MTFDLIWRKGTTDTVLSTWTQHFDPLASGYDAQPYEIEKQAPAIDFSDGDQLVFRYTAKNSTKSEAWIPNGDGKIQHGRIPNITLPE